MEVTSQGFDLKTVRAKTYVRLNQVSALAHFQFTQVLGKEILVFCLASSALTLKISVHLPFQFKDAAFWGFIHLKVCRNV